MAHNRSYPVPAQQLFPGLAARKRIGAAKRMAEAKRMLAEADELDRRWKAYKAKQLGKKAAA